MELVVVHWQGRLALVTAVASLYMAVAGLLAGLELVVQLVLVLVHVLQEVRLQGRREWMRKIGVNHNTPTPAPSPSPAPTPSPSPSPAHSLSPAHAHPPCHSPGGSIGSQPSQGDKESIEDGWNDSGTAPQESLPSNEVRIHPHLFLDLEFSIYRHRLAVHVSCHSQNCPALPVKADLHALLQIKIASKEQARMLLVRLHTSTRRPTPKHTMLHPWESSPQSKIVARQQRLQIRSKPLRSW